MYTSSIDRVDGLSYTGLRTDTRASENNSAQEAEKPRAQLRRASMYTGNNTMSGIAREVEAALAGVEPDANGRITFKQLEEHKKTKEADFAEKVKSDLRALGVDEKIEFRLVSDNNGGVSVISDHKEAALIERYFKANPKMVEEFNKIQMIGNFDRARQFQDRPITDMRKEIQMQGAALFMNSAMTNGMSLASELMDFNEAGFTAGMYGLSRTI